MNADDTFASRGSKNEIQYDNVELFEQDDPEKLPFFLDITRQQAMNLLRTFLKEQKKTWIHSSSLSY